MKKLLVLIIIFCSCSKQKCFTCAVYNVEHTKHELVDYCGVDGDTHQFKDSLNRPVNATCVER